MKFLALTFALLFINAAIWIPTGANPTTTPPLENVAQNAQSTPVKEVKSEEAITPPNALVPEKNSENPIKIEISSEKTNDEITNQVDLKTEASKIDNDSKVTTTAGIPETSVDPDTTTTISTTTMSTTSYAPNDNTTTTPTTTSTTTSTTTTTTPPTTSTTPSTTTTTTSTTSQAPTTSTAAPITTPSPPVPHDKSQWSTTSFIGGMVFASGMMAIGFVAFKFYKARNERNYHTL